MSSAPPIDPLTSPQWHRVADWRPRLCDGVTVSRLWVRGRRWHVLSPPSGGSACRLDPSAYAVAGHLDGRRSLHDVWALLDGASASMAPEPPSQDDIVGVVTALQQHGLLAFERSQAPQSQRAPSPQPGAALLAADEAPAPGQPRNSLLAWRLPLLDPSRLLDALAPVGRWAFSPVGALIWALLFTAMLAALVLHGPALLAHAQTWLSTPRYLLLATLVYPLVKALHELAHGLAVRRWGGRVQEAGITLMMLMPIPYVDASAAHAFSRAWQRAMVSAAGIMAELAMAAIGLSVWAASEPGLARDLGFIVWFIAGVSTLLFNANPLQRLDGYHLLTDALALPNLAPRSQQWWSQHMQAWLSARQGAPSTLADAIVPAAGERAWLLAYAPLAWAYQVALWSGLTWWLGGISAPLGAAIGLIAAWRLLAMPAARWLRMAWQAVLWSSPGGKQHGAAIRRASGLVGLPLLALLLPWPDARVAQGLVWAPDQALVRPEVDGFVLQLHREPGSHVAQGELLIALDNPRLRAERSQAQARLAQAEQNQFGQMGLDSGKAGQASEEAQRWAERLAHLDMQIEQLQVRAHRDGVLVLPRAEDLQGRYLKRGELLGHVMPEGERPMLRVAMPEQAMQDLKTPLGRVAVQAADRRRWAIEGTVLRDGGGASMQLPGAALSQDMGGGIATDPKDASHLRTLRPVVLMDVRLDAAHAEGTWPLGARAWVRFDQGWSPPVVQLWRWARQRVSERFSASR